MKKVGWSSILVATLVLVFGVAAEAQQATKIPRIGYLGGDTARRDAFRQGLRELGYVEGKNIIIEYRSSEGKIDRVREFAVELVRLNVDVIVTGGPQVTRVAKEATVTLPIVMTQDIDPVGNGFVASLARPGGNITGLATLSPEVSGKRLELLKEIIPRLSRVAVLGTSTTPGNVQQLRETEVAAAAAGIRHQYVEVLSPKDIDTAFRMATRERADAGLALASPVLFSQRTQLAELAVKSRLPTIFGSSEYAEVGGLMAYGVNFPDLYRRAATYVDKILKGAKPADLPVEQPTKFELLINLKAAKQIGLTIPPNVLVRADKVIK